MALLVFFVSMGIGSGLFFSHARQLARRAESEATLRGAHENLKSAVDKLATQERFAAIGPMAGTVSHELRNPLGVIRSSVTVIQSMMAGKQLGVERAFANRRLQPTGRGAIGWTWTAANAGLEMVVREIALSAAGLVTDAERRRRIRICANGPCDWMLLDTSRSGRRRWCRMGVCGNVSKVRRFRERQRAAG